MKITFIAIVIVGILVVAFGSPVAKEKPVRDFYYEAPKKILPMSFAHLDHVPVNCVDSPGVMSKKRAA